MTLIGDWGRQPAAAAWQTDGRLWSAGRRPPSCISTGGRPRKSSPYSSPQPNTLSHQRQQRRGGAGTRPGGGFATSRRRVASRPSVGFGSWRRIATVMAKSGPPPGWPSPTAFTAKSVTVPFLREPSLTICVVSAPASTPTISRHACRELPTRTTSQAHSGSRCRDQLLIGDSARHRSEIRDHARARIANQARAMLGVRMQSEVKRTRSVGNA